MDSATPRRPLFTVGGGRHRRDEIHGCITKIVPGSRRIIDRTNQRGADDRGVRVSHNGFHMFWRRDAESGGKRKIGDFANLRDTVPKVRRIAVLSGESLSRKQVDELASHRRNHDRSLPRRIGRKQRAEGEIVTFRSLDQWRDDV